MATRSLNKAATFLQTIDKELICGVCLELFNTPIILPCGHNFCKNCVIELVDSMISFSFLSIGPPNSMNCPLCQAEIDLHRYDIASFPVNKLLESIIRLFESHTQIDVFDTAWNTDTYLASPAGDCSDHKQPADRYCESCNMAVCTTCEHEKHRSGKAMHKIASLKETTLTWQAKVADILAEIKVKSGLLNNRVAILEDILSGTDKQSEQVLKDLDAAVSVIMSSVRRQQTRMKEELGRVLEELKRPVNTELQKCMSQKTTIHENMKKISTIRRTKDTNLRIKLMKDASKQLQSLCISLAWHYQNKDIPSVTMATWQPDMQPVMDAIDNLSWDKGSSRSLGMTSIGVQTGRDLSADDIPSDLPQSGQGLKDKDQGQHEADKNDNNREIIGSAGMNAGDLSSDPEGSVEVEIVSGKYVQSMKSGAKEDIRVLGENASSSQADVQIILASDNNGTEGGVGQTGFIGEAGLAITERGDQKSPKFHKMALEKNSSQRHSCPDGLNMLGGGRGQSSLLGVTEAGSDVGVLPKKPHSRSPSSSSVALANFVARRRTISPHKTAHGNKDLYSRSPEHVSEAGASNSVTAAISMNKRGQGGSIHGVKTMSASQHAEELANNASGNEIVASVPGLSSRNSSDKSNSTEMTMACTGSKCRMPGDGRGEGSRQSLSPLGYGKSGVHSSSFTRAPVKVSLDFNLGNTSVQSSSEGNEKRFTDV